MDDSQWERIAAGMGIVTVVLLLVATVMVPQPPKVDDTAGKVVAYGLDNRSALLVSNWLLALSLFFGLIFLGALRSYLRRVEGGTGRLSAVAFGAGLQAGVIAVIGAAVANALFLHVVKGGTEDAVRALFDLAGALFALLWIPVAAWVGATAVISMRTGAFPRWYGQAGIGMALYFLVVSYGAAVDSGPLGTGGVFQLIAFVLFGLWLLATSLLLMRRLAPTQPIRETSATG